MGAQGSYDSHGRKWGCSWAGVGFSEKCSLNWVLRVHRSPRALQRQHRLRAFARWVFALLIAFPQLCNMRLICSLHNCSEGLVGCVCWAPGRCTGGSLEPQVLCPAPDSRKETNGSQEEVFLDSQFGEQRESPPMPQLTQTGLLKLIPRAVPHLQLSLASDIDCVAFVKAEQGLDGASAHMDSVR